MKTLLAIIIVVVILGIPLLLLCSLFAWFCEGREYPKIKLSEFIKLYYADKKNLTSNEAHMM